MTRAARSLLAALPLLLVALAPSTARAQSAAVCAPAVPMEPRGPGNHDAPERLHPGRHVLRIDGRIQLVVRGDRPVRVDGLAPGVHTVEYFYDGQRIATVRRRLRAGQVLGLVPSDYDGPQVLPARC